MADPIAVASPTNSKAETPSSSSSMADSRLHGHGHAVRIDGHGIEPHLDAASGAGDIDVLRMGETVKASGAFARKHSVAGNQLPVIIAVAGASGSGKTSIAELIAARLEGKAEVLAISSDNYYISVTEDENPMEHNFDHPNSIEFSLLAKHLEGLKKGETVDVPHYDFHTHKRLSSVTTISGTQTDVIIVDGIFVLHSEEVRKQCDLMIFCSEDLDICLARRLARDIEARGRTPSSVIQQYIKFVKPGYHAFVAPSMQHADLIVPRAKENAVAIEMLANEIKRMVERGAPGGN